jgi:hypothetical protein
MRLVVHPELCPSAAISSAASRSSMVSVILPVPTEPVSPDPVASPSASMSSAFMAPRSSAIRRR